MSTNQSAQVAAAEGNGGARGAGAPDARRLRMTLIAVCTALMAVVASVSGLNVAQPDLAVEFGASQSTVLWIINVYTLGLAALLLPLGAIGDRLGRKPMLIAGLIVFGIASVVAGLAPTAEVMLAARVVSGAGAAMIMPITLAVITSTFPEGERSRAIGVWTGVAGGGGVLGMFLSAVLVDVANWRWLFVLGRGARPPGHGPGGPRRLPDTASTAVRHKRIGPPAVSVSGPFPFTPGSPAAGRRRRGRGVC